MHVILCNAPPDAAPALAKLLVESGLAACVNIVPGVRSFYVWQGKLVDDAESTLLIKARAESIGALRAALVAAHPYEIPEVLVLPVEVALSHAPYVEWVRQAGR
ncbi:MAG: divalent-cation tolerance protein CutA [Myxococcales bacterium]|nr:divalent-cation tolerance protein CutA [Myxococcales bacterium]